MHITRETNRLIRSMYSTAAVIVFAAAAVIGVQAQSPVTAPATTLTYPALNFRAALDLPSNLAATSASSSSSSTLSSSSLNVDAPDPGASDAAFDASQPPPRRRYGHPTYSDSHTNADGSAKWTFEVGGGFNVPVSTTSQDLTTGWRFEGGGGRNFNKHFGVLLQYDYDHFGFQSSTLNSLIGIYNNLGAGLNSLGGSSHMWSFTLNPVYNISQGDKWGTYVVGGVGFYHKVADFTTPGLGQYCNIYGCFTYVADQVIDAYVSNAPGFSGGGGVTYKFSRFADERFFVEARYVWVANQTRTYYDGTESFPPPKPGYFNVFPQNGNRTTLIPVTFGVRF